MSFEDDDVDDFDDVPNDRKLFGIDDIKVSYHRSKSGKRITITLDSETPISDMRIFCVLTLEHERWQRRCNILDEIEDLSH